MGEYFYNFVMEKAVPSITENSETIKYNEILLHKIKMKCCTKKEINKVKIPKTTNWEILIILYFHFSKLCYINEFMHLS